MIRHLLFTAMVLAAAPLAHAASPSICLQSFRIDHTDVKDDHTILFYMIDHSVYRNVIPGGCPGLRNDPRGFTYAPIPGSDEICSNLVTIRLNTDGIICELGAFERLPNVKRIP